MAEINKDYAVQMRGITKMFGTFKALDDVCLDVKKGSIHAILGENGAGKSTLMNILYGLYHADNGEIYLNGEPQYVKNPSTAIKLGIGMVHQHFMLIDKFTVMQNITLGWETTDRFGILNGRLAKRNITEIIEKYNIKVNLKDKIRNISVGMQQKVEILKALYRGADILIFDEPTAVLTPMEIDELIEIMNGLVKSGKTVIIITHKLKEIKKSAEECTIIRRGKLIDRVTVSEETEKSLACKMVGRDVKLVVNKSPAVFGEKVFEIDNITVKSDRGIDAVKGLSLSIRKGEILGLAGIEGNGQKELIEAMICAKNVESGTIKIDNREVQNTSPRNILNHGISLIHADRHKYGIVLDFTVAENAILEKYRNAPYSQRGFLNDKERDNFTNKLIKEYDIRPSDCKNCLIRELSGGNQQKLVIGREIANEPELLIAVQPTRGLDVGAIEYVHKTLIALRDKNKAILLISLELDEIMTVSDTIAVLYDGKINGTFKQGEVDENVIGLLMAGGQENEKCC